MAPSVLILTLNEDSNLPDCLASVAWSDDVVVLDSFSTDSTAEIAETAGARVIRRPFDNWASHQNWAVRNIDFKHPWVFYLDADERCDDVLAGELTSPDPLADTDAAFQVRRKDYFMGRWLRRAQFYPTWLTRVFRPDRIRYERLVNPVAVVDGPIGQLRGHLIHHPFSHGLAHWVARHNNYSDMEAQQWLDETQGRQDWAGLLAGDATRRRRALKQLAYRLPGRPALVFGYLYLLRMGFLDGRAGLTYCRLRAMYERMIDVKIAELQRRRKNLPI